MSNEGMKVSVHYVGTLDDGTKFDSSRDRGEALEFVCMAGQMIPGFDAAVRDMAIGQVVNVHLEPADAYGERREELVQAAPLAEMPGAETLAVGTKVMLTNSYGWPIPATVVAKDETTITFDMNHELAGQALNFEIELLEVSENTGCNCGSCGGCGEDGCGDCGDGCDGDCNCDGGCGC